MLHGRGGLTPIQVVCLICIIRFQVDGTLALEEKDHSFGMRMSQETIRKQRDGTPLMNKKI